MKAIVGVMPLWDEERESLWMLPAYLDAVREVGGLPIVFPFTEDEAELEQLTRLCDGFLLTGGQDVSPALYGEAPLEGLTVTCPKRDEMEGIVLRLALDRDKPILGVCRGLQFLNASLGGTLWQDLPTQRPSEIAHRQDLPKDRPTHGVTLVEDSPLRRCLGVERLAVNSAHHQAIRALAPGLRAMAFAPDGLTEAFWMPERRFLWGVQWHPEQLYRADAPSRAIFRAFVEAMKTDS